MDAANHAEQLIALPENDESDAADAPRFRHVSLQKGLLYNAWVLARDSNVLTCSPSQSLINIVLCMIQIVLTFLLIKGPGTLTWWHYFDTSRIMAHLMLRVVLLIFQYRLTKARILQVSGTEGAFVEPHGAVFAIQLAQFGLWVSNMIGIMLATTLPFFLLIVAVTPSLVTEDVLLSFSMAGLTALLHILASIPQIALIKKDLALVQLRETQTRMTAAAGADANQLEQGVRPSRRSHKESDGLRQAMAAIARMELKAKQDLEYQEAVFTDAAEVPSRVEPSLVPQPVPVNSSPAVLAASTEISELPSSAVSKEEILESKKVRLGEEPIASLKEGVVNIQVRFPSGKVLRRRFLSTSSLQDLFDAIDTFSPEGVQGISGEDISLCYEIQCSFPKLTLDPSMLSPSSASSLSPLTFQTLGLLTSHSFFVKEKLQEEDS